jgi:hypothetical protein
MMVKLETTKELRTWWETRRLRYNLWLIVSGFILLGILWLANKASVNVFLFPVGGNLCGSDEFHVPFILVNIVAYLASV